MACHPSMRYSPCHHSVQHQRDRLQRICGPHDQHMACHPSMRYSPCHHSVQHQRDRLQRICGPHDQHMACHPSMRYSPCHHSVQHQQDRLQRICGPHGRHMASSNFHWHCTLCSPCHHSVPRPFHICPHIYVRCDPHMAWYRRMLHSLCCHWPQLVPDLSDTFQRICAPRDQHTCQHHTLRISCLLAPSPGSILQRSPSPPSTVCRL